MEYNFETIPPISTQRLVLRKMEIRDATALFPMRNDERVMQYIQRPRPKTLADAEKMVADIIASYTTKDRLGLAITIKGEDEFIGNIGYWRIDAANYRAEIGYMLHPDYFRRGIMQEAIQPIIALGFNEMQLHTIEARTHKDNVASVALLEKNGFEQEGYIKEDYFFDGQFYDSRLFGLQKSSWLAFS